jgi:hypothetical protein
MGRTVISKNDVARGMRRAEGSLASEVQKGSRESKSEQPPSVDQYKDRLIKYIPADIVAIYLTLTGLLKMADPHKTPMQLVGWIIFGVIFLISFPWQMKIAKITKWSQVFIGSLAFVFWAISLGDPFATAWQNWYQPLYGSMALALYTFLIPLFEG